MVIGFPAGKRQVTPTIISAKPAPTITLSIERAPTIDASHATSRNSFDTEFNTTAIST
jgi:hypothetical protein